MSLSYSPARSLLTRPCGAWRIVCAHEFWRALSRVSVVDGYAGRAK